MSDSEFSLIQRYFKHPRDHRADVILGIGDDCALLKVPNDQLLAVSLDVMVEKVHFLAGSDPQALGHKALAVNLSDLAAQGAQPAWVTLGLTLPHIDTSWLEGFCQGFFALAKQFDVQLVGGDTTRGALTIAVQAHGFVDQEKALCRHGARPGDGIFVTGTLGDAALGLKLMKQEIDIAPADAEYLRARLERPTPRVTQGLQLAGLASAAIDISDGLAQDLGHILSASATGARVWLQQLPLSTAMTRCLDETAAIETALSGGDDYELCFTVAPERVVDLEKLMTRWDCRCSRIGIIEAQPGLRLLTRDGEFMSLEKAGYDHFS